MKYMIDILSKPVQLKIFGKDISLPLIVILAILGLLISIYFTRYMFQQDKWNTLDVQVHKYSIDYPATWNETTYGSSGGQGSHLDYITGRINTFFGPDILIHKTELEQPSLTDAAEWGQEILKASNPRRITPLAETHIGHGNYPALMQSFTERNAPAKAFYAVSGDYAYMIEINQINENSQPIIDQILDSFRLYDESEN